MICTTIKQSKQLLEAGIDPFTADMSYAINITNGEYELMARKFESLGDLPCWSMAALWEICRYRGIELEFSTGDDKAMNIIGTLVMTIINNIEEALKSDLEFIKEKIK